MNKKQKAPLAGAKLVKCIVTAAQEKLAEKITVLDLKETTATADFFVVCESETTVQNRAIADEIRDACTKKGTVPWRFEGEDDGRWVLLDFSDVVVHIMLPELRAYYNLEKLWTKGKITELPGAESGKE